MNIKILSNSTINKISAGEVIERPASVVKELVENSIDAGADKIEITLECAGKNLIIIKDNGKGMSKPELELAVQRHTTSKLDESNLLNIHSFGFRGEALPSIGAISKFKITSKSKNDEIGHSLLIVGGKQEDCTLVNCYIGTIIEVRDLFFATPARLKFLRTDRTELTAIINWIKKIALSHPHISFNVTHNNKQLLKVKKQTTEDRVENRIAEIMNDEFIKNSTKILYSVEGISINGYTGLPTYNRATADEQYLFINNRPVKDKILNIALRVSYQDYLARDRSPISVIFLSINPEQVDVNVHPAKNEVRFHDPNLIRRVVISAIKEALQNSSHRVSTMPSYNAINYIQNNSKRHESTLHENFTKQPRLNLPTLQKTNGPTTTIRTDYAITQNKDITHTPRELINSTPEASIEEPNDSYKELEHKFPLGAAKAQIFNTYIISQTDDGLTITDQHAAHERIGYEKIKKQIANNGLIKQRLLIPEIVELPTPDKAETLYEHKDMLIQLGLTIEFFGKQTIIVSEIPSLIGDINIPNLISDLADYLTSFGENIALTELIEHVTETYACHYAIRAGRKLNGEEMNELLRQIENTPFAGQCNHGRQTYIKLKLTDIEKLFGRR